VPHLFPGRFSPRGTAGQGTVQRAGSEVDRLCGELGTAIDALRRLQCDRADSEQQEPTPAEQAEAAGRQEAASRPKTYRAYDRKGRQVRVTIAGE
jgi:hypothetical protein